MQRFISRVLFVLLAVLAVGVLVGQIIWIPALATHELTNDPGAIVPVSVLSVVGIALGVCAQIALVGVARIVRAIGARPPVRDSVRNSLTVIAVASATASAIILALLIIAESTDGPGPQELPPGVGALMLGAVVALVAVALLMTTVRASLSDQPT